jgi:nitrogen fixation-related uncharacterized protein
VLIRILDKTKTKQFEDTKGLIRILDITKTKQFEDTIGFQTVLFLFYLIF